MMKFTITIYQDEEGWYVAECPLIPGCLSQGRTDEQAINNILKAIDLCLAVRKDKGLPLTISSQEIDIPVPALPVPLAL